MPTNKLTDPSCKNARKRGKAYRLADGQGLTLLVKPTGSKLWHYRFRLAGKEQIYSVGQYPEVSLKEARDARDAARKLVADGIHPGHYRQAKRERLEAERKARAAEKQDTVSVLIDDWQRHNKTADR